MIVARQPEQQAAVQAQAARPVVCSTGGDCEVKWGRALQWVLNNSAYKVQSQSDAMISTMGPLPDDPRPAYTITKMAQGNGTYLIDFRAGCDNIFGCVPNLMVAKADFVVAVMGSR
ncbi:MAG TPA: hypothetical protein VKZ79_00635 [Alphaproteobacteria bacterium]|nr:hypothetical protein [Alphaproteobacteria bacterium]